MMYFCIMDSTRQLKIGRLLQKDIGEILQREPSFRGGALITVTKVNVTSDLSLARVNLSIFATQDKSAVLKIVESHSQEIRHKLGQRIRHQVRIIPELQFFIDDTLDQMERIDELLKQ